MPRKWQFREYQYNKQKQRSSTNRRSIKNQRYIRGRINKVYTKKKSGNIKFIIGSRKTKPIVAFFLFDNVVDYPEQKIQVGDYVKFHLHCMNNNKQAFDIVRCPEPNQSASTPTTTPSSKKYSARPTPTFTLSVEECTSSLRTTIVPLPKRKNSSPVSEFTQMDKVMNGRKIFRSTLMSSESAQESKPADYYRQHQNTTAATLQELSTFPTNRHQTGMYAQGDNPYLHTNIPCAQNNSVIPMYIQPDYLGMDMMPSQQNFFIPEQSQLMYLPQPMISDINHIADPAICYPNPSVFYMNGMVPPPTTLYTQFDPISGVPYTQPAPNASYTILQPSTSVLTPFDYNSFATPL